MLSVECVRFCSKGGRVSMIVRIMLVLLLYNHHNYCSSQACLGASRIYARAGCGGKGHVQQGAAILCVALCKAISITCGYFSSFWIVIDVYWDFYPALYISLVYSSGQFHWNTRFPHLDRPGVENPRTLRTLCQQNWAWLGASRWHSGEPVELPLNVYHEHPWATCASRPNVRKPYYRRESIGQPHLKNTLILEEILYREIMMILKCIYFTYVTDLHMRRFRLVDSKLGKPSHHQLRPHVVNIRMKGPTLLNSKVSFALQSMFQLFACGRIARCSQAS